MRETTGTEPRATLNRKVFVTGGAGYVGSKLIPSLLDQGFEVVVYDTFWYGKDVFNSVSNTQGLELIEGDIRDKSKIEESLTNCTDVIHLACISNDPSYDLNPKIGEDINFNSFEPLVNLSIKKGVRRFIYASSSSVYGMKEEDNVTEKLSLNPLTDYSKFKALCEPLLLEKTSPNFVTTVLRPATLCGYAPRQRLDLSVNILTNHAVNERIIKIFGGQQYRPNLHIDDMCMAYLSILQQPENVITGEIFNVGGENLTIKEIADIVSTEVGQPLEIKVEDTPDKRSYRISSEYIKEKIEFTPQKGVKDAVLDLKHAFASGLLIDSLTNSRYFNIKKMNELLNSTNEFQQ